MSTLTPITGILHESLPIEVTLIHDALDAQAKVIHEKVTIEVECDCSIKTNNALLASDGVLYSSDGPIFITE